MIKLFKSKKGIDAENAFLPVVSLFVFGLLAILIYYIQSRFNAEYVAAGVLPASGAAVADKFLTAIAWHDWIIVVIMILFIIAGGIVNLRISAERAFFVVTFILIAFYGLVSYFFNFIFAQIVSEPFLATTILHFPKTILLCTNFHWIILFHVIVSSIALYAKKRQGQYI